MKTSIIIPTYYRPHQLRRNVERMIETVADLDTEIVVVADGDERALDQVRDLPLRMACHPEWRGSVAGWNTGASLATGDLFVTGADDLWPLDGWLHKALEQMELAGVCYCGLNDLMWDGWCNNVTHWVITRQGVIDHCGGCLMPPVYKTTWPDTEIMMRIKRAGQFTWCKQAIVDHRHFSNHKAPVDKSYMIMNRYFAVDKALFERRMAAGFPDDFPACVKAVPDAH